MGFKRPSGGAITLFATFVFGGIGLAYLPTQISNFPGLEDTWQARYGSELATIGLVIVALALLTFASWHVRWPTWAIELRRLRLRMYKSPYLADVFLANAKSHIVGFLKVTRRSGELKPYGWDERDPFIRVTYHVFNGSLFKIYFDNPKGELYLGTSKLLDEPKVCNGQGWWESQSTASLKIDQRLKLEMWKELEKYAEESPILERLRGGFSVSLQNDASEEVLGFSLHSDEPFLVDKPNR